MQMRCIFFSLFFDIFVEVLQSELQMQLQHATTECGKCGKQQAVSSKQLATCNWQHVANIDFKYEYIRSIMN